jgi:hypothetical protein
MRSRISQLSAATVAVLKVTLATGGRDSRMIHWPLSGRRS